MQIKMHNHIIENEYKIKVYKRRDGILTLFFSNASIYYSHVTGIFSDNYYTGNVHLKYLRVMAELPKYNSLKLAAIKVTWPRCKNMQTSSGRQGKEAFTPFLVPPCCKLSSHCSVTDSKWVCTSTPVTHQWPAIKMSRQSCPNSCPYTSTVKNDLSQNNPIWTHTWTSALEKSSPFICSVISWAAWDKMG